GLLSLHVLLGGVGSSVWKGVTIAFGGSPAGVTLSLTPDGATSAIQILPTFSGLGTLAAGATALLPAALDALVAALKNPTLPPLAKLVVDVATALDLYDATDTVDGFSKRAGKLREMLQ